MTAKVKVADAPQVEEELPNAKKKTCFVVMPIADMNGYENGHFARVYEYLIKPALEKNNYAVERADDTVKSDYIVVGIVKKIITSDLVICDLSGRNPNVMYELGIRHAFDKPVVLIKDKVTEKVFDIQGLRYYEYEQSLRIDTVKKDVEKISMSIQETFEDKGKSINSLVALASVKSATIPDDTPITAEGQLILNALNSIGKKLDLNEHSDQEDVRHGFKVIGSRVIFNDGSSGGIGTEIYDENKDSLGHITRMASRVDGSTLYLKGHDGSNTVIKSYAKNARTISEMPF